MKAHEKALESEKKITNSLFKLMAEKPFLKISIKEICQTAGISRLTFYRHYSIKEDIIKQYTKNIFERYYQELRSLNISTLRDALVLCFNFWINDYNVTKLLINNELSPIIYNSFNKYFERILILDLLPKNINHFQKKFIIGGLLNVLFEWSYDTKQMTAENMADLVLDIVAII